MLTQHEIDGACAKPDGPRLWEPTDEPIRRCLYLAPQVRSAIHSFVAAESSKRGAQLIDDLDHYAAGRLLIIAEKGNLKLLKQPTRFDWNLRSVAEPQFRLIGCFARPDSFVALYGAPRSTFSRGWVKERGEAEKAWKSLFGARPWLVGSLIGQFVTENTDPDASQPIP